MIQTDQAQAGVSLQQQGTVTAPAKGGIDQQPLGTRKQLGGIQNRLSQDRQMKKRGNFWLGFHDHHYIENAKTALK